MLRLILLCVISTHPSTHRAIDLFPLDQKTLSVRLLKVPQLLPVERIERDEVFQVFRDTRTGRDLFRVPIGSRSGNEVTRYWHFGLTARGDFNHDGVEDYAWYGGDDTSDDMLLILSSSRGYRIVDLLETLANEWVRRFHSEKPDLKEAGFPLGITFKLENGHNDLVLVCELTRQDLLRPPPGAPHRPAEVRIPEARFTVQR
jgi:hypothetical protein